MRKGKWITTYNNVKFYPLDSRPEEILLEDIAHALSLLCRGNGHVKHFFSVAQHSIHCALEAKTRGFSEKVQLALLLHDASEAYLSDITRPVKAMLTEYLQVEEKLQGEIYDKFGVQSLTKEEIEQVNLVDDAMLNYEMIHLMDGKPVNELELVGSYDLDFQDMGQVRDRFLALFAELRD